VRNTIDLLLLIIPSTEAFDKLYLRKREDAEDVIIFISTIIKERYDSRYTAIYIK